MISVRSPQAKRILANWLTENDPTALAWFAAAAQQFDGDHTYGYSHRDDLYQALKNNSMRAKNEAVSKARRTLVTG